MRQARRLVLRLGAALLAGSTLAACNGDRQVEPLLTVHLWKAGLTPCEVKFGDPVAAGDSLYLTLISRRALHLYVLSEDANRMRQLLYPCRGWDPSRPLRALRPERLPPPLLGRETFWPVASVTAREHVLLVSCVRPIAVLDDTVQASGNAAACGAALGSSANRWLDSLALVGSDAGRDHSGPRRGTWKARSPAQEGWFMDFGLVGASAHG